MANTIRYEVRDIRGRREASFREEAEAREYCVFVRSYSRRTLEIYVRTYYGPEAVVGQRASFATLLR